MDTKLFLELSGQARTALIGKDIQLALQKMESMLYLQPNSKIENNLNSLSNAFEGMLNCIRKGIQDENRAQSFQQMYAQSWNLLFDLKHEFKCNLIAFPHYKAKECTAVKTPYWIFCNDLKEAKNDTSDGSAHVKTYTILFAQLWISTTLTQEDYNDLQAILNEEQVMQEDKLLIISVLMLSTIEYPDNKKMALLNELCHSKSPQIQVRAMVGMMIITLITSQYQIFNEELERFCQIMTKEENQDKFCVIAAGYYNAIHAKKFSKHFNETILPQLHKIQGVDYNPKEDQVFSINLDIKENMKNSIERMTNSGKDIYFGLFKYFKSFPFFLNMANWFYPFCKNHKETKAFFSAKKASFTEVLVDRAPFCDNDKWSMFFLMQSSNANIILPMDIEKNLKPQSEMTWRQICFDYIHDLYRFYSSCPFSGGSQNPFREKYSLDHLFSKLDAAHLSEMAKISMEHEYYSEAIMILEDIPVLNLNQKKMMAYSLQRVHDYDSAIEYYKLCLEEKEDAKIKKRLAVCYKEMKEWQKAADTYADLADTDSKNELKYLMQQADCLIQMEKFEEALKLLYKVEYLQCNHLQALREIIWCNLRITQPEKALKYWLKIEKKDADDWLNGGHAYWCMNNMKSAYDCYQRYFDEKEDKETAVQQFKDDISTLEQYGFSDIDSALMLQAVNH